MMKRGRLQLAAMILLPLLLSACGPQRPVLVLPPADLATCADEPLAPSIGGLGQTERDALTLDYILGLRSAWGDCRAKVDGLRVWRETAKADRGAGVGARA